jgi:transcriptional regulator with XRE-family HTH domain
MRLRGRSAVTAALDPEALFTALDAKRRSIARATLGGFSWRAVARELGISQSTFTRLGVHHHMPSAEILVKLLGWLGETDLAPYLTCTDSPEEENKP